MPPVPVVRVVRDVVHKQSKDIKLENLMVASRQPLVVKLIDFGQVLGLIFQFLMMAKKEQQMECACSRKNGPKPSGTPAMNCVEAVMHDQSHERMRSVVRLSDLISL